jgi:hypothetical protein
LQTPAPTLQDFVLKLLSEPDAQQAFDLDPVAALSDAGLSDVSPQDVMDAIPLVLDFASASGDGLGVEAHGAGGLGGLSGWGGVESPFGGGSAGASVSPDGLHSNGGFGSPVAGSEYSLDAGLDGVSGHQTFNTALGGGGFQFGDGLVPEVALPGLDSDTLGRGGDLVTGTVAGYISDGAGTFSEVFTEGAGALAAGIGSGASTVDSMITDGATELSGTVADPTSAQLPAVAPDLTGGLPAGLPMDLPAAPALPDLGGGLPGLDDLPGLGELPIDLPVDLPNVPLNLPELPHVPEVPGLPSLPSTGVVHDTVADVTGHLPVLGDLTDGVMDNLPFGH